MSESKTPRTDAYGEQAVDLRDDRAVSECFQGWSKLCAELEMELAAMTERAEKAEEEAADSEQLRCEENRRACEWMDKYLVTEAAKREAVEEMRERCARACDELKNRGHNVPFREIAADAIRALPIETEEK